jgi:hypothetical protein
MAEGHSRVLAPAPASTAGGTTSRRTQRTFYVALSVLMTMLVGIGFWPSYYGPLMRGAAEAPVVLHVHGVIYVGWLALLIVQAILAARGRIRAHRSLGAVGIGYGAIVWLVGILVSFVAPVMHVNAGEWTIDEAAAFLPIPFGDMLLFGGFLAAAAAYRHRPEVHKRLMLLATVAIVFAAVFRLQAAGLPTPAAIALWFVPVLLGIAYDALTRGQVHPVYWIGAAAMALALLRLPFRNSDFWLGIGRPLFESLT